MNIQIKIGDDQTSPEYTFVSSQVMSIDADTACDLIGNELSIDTITFDVSNDLTEAIEIEHGTKVCLYDGSNIRGIYYCDYVEQIASKTYRVHAFTEIGLLNEQTDVGWFGENVAFCTADKSAKWHIQRIMGNAYSYEIEDRLDDLILSGWLPYATKRENLHRVMLAGNINLVRKDDGSLLFTSLIVSEPETVAGKIYSGTVSNDSLTASDINVTEYSYSFQAHTSFGDWSYDEPYTVVFDNTESHPLTEDTIVLFDDPSCCKYCIDPRYEEPLNIPAFTKTGSITVLDFGANYCKLAAGSQGSISFPMVHSYKKIKSLHNSEARIEKVITMDNTTMVTSRNSYNVLERLRRYFFGAKKITVDFVLGTEKCGRNFSFLNELTGQTSSGYIQRMSYKVSKTIRARSEFITDYTPVGGGGMYSECIELINSISMLKASRLAREKAALLNDGETLPIIAIAIGNGTNGTDGADGESGNASSAVSNVGEGGIGGGGGTGGNGGKVNAVTLHLPKNWNGMISFTTTTDVGLFVTGAYKPDTQIPDTEIVTVNVLSEDGQRYQNGWVNPIDGKTYARPGKNGIDGSNGGDGGKWNDFYTIQGDTSRNAEPTGGEGFGGGGYPPRFTVKANQQPTIIHEVPAYYWNVDVYPGEGGGGGSGEIQGGFAEFLKAGDGANGANGADGIRYGDGGDGGNGGGGGGGTGYNHNEEYCVSQQDQIWLFLDQAKLTSSTVGQGGQGGQGGTGKNGIAMVII